MERLLAGESASPCGELRTAIGQTQNEKLLRRKFNWCIKHNVPTWNGFVPSCCFETFNIHENSVGFAVDDFTFLLNSGDSKIWNKSMGKQVKLMAMQKQFLLYGGVCELVIYGESCILIDCPSAYNAPILPVPDPFFSARKDSVLAISIIPYWYLILRVLSACLHRGGTRSRWGNPLRWGNPPVSHMVAPPIM